METIFASINYHDPIWIAVAFLFGFLVWQMGLPPLVGYLVAGFALNFLGATGGGFLQDMADLGVTLLLFSIGLKLQINKLLKPEVWGVATAHMAIACIGVAALLLLLASFGIPFLSQLTPAGALLVAFMLSFSSTVFAIKVLEDKGDSGSHYGRIAVGVLVVQDIAAVIFLAASTAEMPSPWAMAIIAGLFILRPALLTLLTRAGHGELLLLYGLALALGGASMFELVHLKGDLGALIFGMLLASHPKASEMAKALLNLKDLFLVGFFLSIGLNAEITLGAGIIGLLLLALLPVKSFAYFLLFSRFNVRARSATLASLSLTNFSEFGLIVCAIATAKGWLQPEWLAATAIVVALSFTLASPLNVYGDWIYRRMLPWQRRFERKRSIKTDELMHLGDAQVLICGMGRVGCSVYGEMEKSYSGRVIGLEEDDTTIARHWKSSRNVMRGDVTNPDFWDWVCAKDAQVQLVMLCLPNVKSNLKAANLLREWGLKGRIAAIAHFPDEVDRLKEGGIDAVFNLYAEAGSGFAKDSLRLMQPIADS